MVAQNLPVLENDPTTIQELPFTINKSKKLGRYAIASHDIRAGDIVLYEKPVCAVPFLQYSRQICHNCFKATDPNKLYYPGGIDVRSIQIVIATLQHDRGSLEKFLKKIKSIYPTYDCYECAKQKESIDRQIFFQQPLIDLVCEKMDIQEDLVYATYQLICLKKLMTPQKPQSEIKSIPQDKLQPLGVDIRQDQVVNSHNIENTGIQQSKQIQNHGGGNQEVGIDYEFWSILYGQELNPYKLKKNLQNNQGPMTLKEANGEHAQVYEKEHVSIKQGDEQQSHTDHNHHEHDSCHHDHDHNHCSHDHGQQGHDNSHLDHKHHNCSHQNHSHNDHSHNDHSPYDHDHCNHNHDHSHHDNYYNPYEHAYEHDPCQCCSPKNGPQSLSINETRSNIQVEEYIASMKGFKQLQPGYGDAKLLTCRYDQLEEKLRKKVKGAMKMLVDLQPKLFANEEEAQRNNLLYGVSVSELNDLAAIISQNAYVCSSDDNQADIKGMGLYPVAALFNHSCRPNCIITHFRSNVVARAVVEIKKGQEMFFTYGPLMEPRRKRQSYLKEQKHFLCHCSRCTENMNESTDALLEGMPCKKCSGVTVSTDLEFDISNPILLDFCKDWKCLQCESVYPATTNKKDGPMDVLLQLQNDRALALQKHEEAYKYAYTKPYMKTQIFKMLDETIELFNGILNKFVKTGQVLASNYLVFDILQPLINCQRRRGQAKEGLVNTYQIISIEEQVLKSKNTYEIGNLYQSAGELNEILSQFYEQKALKKRYLIQAKKDYQTCYDIRKICLGQAHTQTIEVQNQLKSISKTHIK